jgi:hypothetical protein
METIRYDLYRYHEIFWQFRQVLWSELSNCLLVQYIYWLQPTFALSISKSWNSGVGRTNQRSELIWRVIYLCLAKSPILSWLNMPSGDLRESTIKIRHKQMIMVSLGPLSGAICLWFRTDKDVIEWVVHVIFIHWLNSWVGILIFFLMQAAVWFFPSQKMEIFGSHRWKLI